MKNLKDKKILFITLKLGGGGAERVTMTLCNYMHSRGYDVSVLAIDGEDDSYAALPGLKVTCLHPKSGKVPGMVSRLAGIRRHVDRERPDIIVNLGGGYRYVDQLRLYDKAELVFSERNYPPMVYGRRQMRQAVRLCSRASKVVFQTPGARECYPEEVQRKSAIIPNPVMGGLPEWVGYGKASKRVVTFCRLVPQKNLGLLIDAFAIFLSNRHAGWVLDIYGEGGMQGELLSKAEGLGISDSVRIMPFTKDIHEKVRDAAMFVSSSDFEGLQNSLIECMAMGMPCIATDCLGGGAWMISENSTRCALVERGDSKELASAMCSIADDERVALGYSANSKKLRESWSSEMICDAWINYLES